MKMMATETRDIRKAVLPNGMVIITEPMGHVRSVSIGIWLKAGSRREPAPLNGICHFIEHMVFKGTERRTAEEIARSVDSVGGMLDAFTAKEMVCFNTKVLDEHLPFAFDVLADMTLRPLFAAPDIEKEKSVVLEEIKMDQDNPDYLVHEVFTQNFWRNHALGKPILGTPDTVKAFQQDSLRQCFRSWYAPNHLVVTAAGSLEHQKVVDLIAQQFAEMKPAADGFADPVPVAEPGIVNRKKRELEQVHICLGVTAYPMAHEKRFAVAVLNNILGGGMSSRLFQNIRERQGLAYAVFSDLSPYTDTGLLSIYAGTARETVEKLVHSVMQELRSLKESPVPAEELRRAKDHLKGSLMLSLESTTSRMTNLARHEMYFGRFFTLDELLQSIEAVTADEVQALARDLFQPRKIGATVLGNLDRFELTRAHLAC